MANQGDDDDSIVKHKLATTAVREKVNAEFFVHNLCNILACACKETVDKRRESSRGSCSPSKRPLLGGECPSNYIRKIQNVMETLIASLELYLFIF